MPKGSLWNKWDLHLHSPQTFLNNGFNGCSIEDYVQSVVASGVKAVGLTNYFRFDDEFEKVKQELNNKGIVVFPNLEFRTQPQNKENEEMHVHLVFSDKTPLTDIEDFLSRLQTVDNKYCKNLTEQEIATTMISLDGLRNTLKTEANLTHYKDYLLIACPRGQGNFRPSATDDGRGNNFAIVIDRATDILFGDVGDTEHFLNKDRFQDAEQKPVIRCSDAHKLEDIESAFTWIKADLTFEGLKQILWEPADRVKIQDRNPSDTKPGRTVIDKLTYKDSGGNDHVVELNKDLDSIIGVRGSGKSTLLKNIAFTVDPVQFAERGDKEEKLYKLDDFKVIWADGQENAGDDESPKSVFYIPQNYLSMLAYDESGKESERDAFLTDLLKKNAKFANAIRSYEDFVSDNKIKIEGLIEELLKSDQNLKEAKKQLKKQGSRKEIEGEIDSKNKEIKKYQKLKTGEALTDAEVKSYTDASEIVTNNNKTIIILEQDRTILDGLLQSGAQVMSIASQEIARLSSTRQLTLRNELLKKSKENLEELIIIEIENIDEEISKLKQAVGEKQKDIDKLAAKIQANKALATLTTELGQLQQILKAIGELEASIIQLNQTKEDSLLGLIAAYMDFDIKQQAIFGTIAFEDDFEFLKIDIVAYYNLSDLKRFVGNNINTVSTSPKLSSSDQDLRRLFGDTPARPAADTVKKFITKLVDGEIILKVEAGDISQIISSLLKDRFEIDFLNSVKTKEDEVLFKNMTGGQKAIAMLELVFSFDDERYPILIDQPEDDLDVGGVATDLVKFVRKKKIERQIIIVSHNASLVICADTENVIVSNSEKVDSNQYNFSYQTGAIENSQIREKLIEILEGGKEALRQRARKLDFKREI